MTTTYIIRHAEAEGNLYRRGQGHLDGKVTIKGRQQIAALAERFKAVPIDIIYCSDLSRTRETAGAILKYHPGLEIIEDARLKEINMGVWEDKNWGNIAYEDPEMLRNFNFNPDKWSVPGGESFAKLQKRITGAVFDIANKNDGKTIAIFSHGMAIRSFLCGILGVPSEDTMTVRHCENTGVSLLEISGGKAEIIIMNDASHLSEELTVLEKQSWWKDKRGDEETNLRLDPLDPINDADFYSDCYESAWLFGHGTTAGYDREICLARLREHVSAHPLAAMKAFRGGSAAGLIELDTRRGEREGYGWLTLCCMTDKNRGERLGIQLIGHAVHVYRKLGRTALRLHVFAGNVHAVSFYKKHGFCEIGRETGPAGELLLMELPL